ncbi:prolyl oligopeptidase family serine peptidase [uncultured Paludibaculum sp.]|uniref:alpha/beta hydrolase family protein n=1 Tax=uncultured Paludibaculum sp. TaxID=1765020 RepID=UPI002AAC288F|nr:prolyl oligopeptidase family serine peptidase [uncultured Paludibaculum sp.]
MQSILTKPAPDSDARLAYGTDPNQFGELYLPKATGPHPTMIVIHGGFWRAANDLKHIGHLCKALSTEGVACFSLEYRRLGNAGGGWTGTFDDIRAGAAFLARNLGKYNLNPKRLGVTGHSAGGHLALWLAAEKVMPLKTVVSLAGVADLRRAYELKLNNNVVGELLGGGPAEHPDRYARSSPIERLPLKVFTRLIHGMKDQVVPIEISRRYEAAARKAGDDARLIPLPATAHFELIDPGAIEYRLVSSTIRSGLL